MRLMKQVRRGGNVEVNISNSHHYTLKILLKNENRELFPVKSWTERVKLIRWNKSGIIQKSSFICLHRYSTYNTYDQLVAFIMSKRQHNKLLTNHKYGR